MIEHVSIPVSDYQKSKKFYIQTLAPLGYANNMEFGEAAGFMEGGHTSFWIAKKDTVVPSHVAFLAKSKEEVQKFHAAGIEAGGKDNGAPGFRTDYGDDYYAAFVLDPDGSNIEACYFGEKAPK
jgi:predicted lactoylglutathione lyase